VFNIWYDFGQFVPGRYPIEIRLIDAAGATRSHHDRILIVEPVPESCHPDSDGLIVLPPGDPRPVEVRLTERPTIVHRAERRLFARTPRNILVQRTDQLGDMVASIPAILRLRALFPEARIVGLLTAANADFAGTLSLFDEIVTIAFPDDPVERRRLMTLDDQAALRDRLAPYRFDVAIDLATSGVSRPLLRLSGAPFTMGMGDAAWPWLSAGFDFNTHDPVTRLDVIPHSAKVLAMVEALGAVLTSPSRIIHGEDLTRDILVPLGIAADQSYILLHAGARIGFSHWPHYPALARLLLERTDRHVVLLTENASLGSMLPLELRDSDRFLLIDRRLPFNELDAILSFADVMVGNDSGPKHLAALRGTQVVTLFTNRISYAEWGQEQTGVIMARKVPCAGCQLLHDTDECGKAFACITGIRPDEVLDVVLGLL
jgi:ADP-heptose:LPS heptosyltransferase